MKTQMCAYEITRCYIVDNANSLTQEVLNNVLGKCRARDFKGLASISSLFDWNKRSVVEFRVLRQVEAFFKKNSDFANDDECTVAALSSFERGERICRITNRRLDHYFMKRERLAPDLQSYMRRAEHYISNVLGSFTHFRSSIPERIKITSGASALSPRSKSLPFMKLSRNVDCTPGAEPYLRALYAYYGYKAPRFQHLLFNRVELVPKSWKTHRTIACEPSGNVPLQLAFDNYVKSRLRRRGIDLSDQTPNQRHAFEGSTTGSIATIDLSMASDTVSLNAVSWLLPADWYSYIRDVRSPCFQLKGSKMQKYHKFSSMGNGCTFALETLIFASLLHAVGSKIGLVYGDDITIETELAPALFRLLKFLGFVPNEEKSYTSGPFRESCGKDFFEGHDVTPFYLRSTDVWDVPNACHNVNGLAAISEYGKLWDYLKSFTKDIGLPLVPYNEDTTSGVRISPYFAYGLGLIRKNKRGILEHKRLIRKEGAIVIHDSRALFFWFFLRKKDQLLLGEDPINAGRYTTSSPKYRRKWVTWRYPGPGISNHLFGWSEELTRESQ